MFITGEDGNDYYSHLKYVKNKGGEELWCEGYWLGAWDVYGYEGNIVTFDVSEDQVSKDGSPVAVNVWLDTTTPDPRLHEKLLTKREHEENRARHVQNRVKAEHKQASAEIEKDMTVYIIQQKAGEKWANVYDGETLCWFRTVEDAKAKIEEMREYGDRYRLKKGRILKNYLTGKETVVPY